jgi:hypothetical protein
MRAMCVVLSCLLAAPAWADCDAACAATKILSGGMGDPRMAAVAGAIAAPIILAGAAVTVAKTGHEKPLTGVTTDERGKPTLTLVPSADPEPWNAPDRGIAPSRLPKPTRTSELVTAGVTAAVGAAVLGGIISGFAKKKR